MGKQQEHGVFHWKTPEGAKDGGWKHSPNSIKGDFMDRAAHQDLHFPEEEFSHTKDFIGRAHENKHP